MKKSVLFRFFVFLGALTTVFVAFYLYKDLLMDTPLGRLFGADDEDFEYYEEHDLEEEAEKPAPAEVVAPAKEKSNKVRRGYISLKFHEDN